MLKYLCLDKAYNSTQEEQELIKRGYVLYISPKKKRGGAEVQVTTQPCLNRKKYSPRRWIVEELIHCIIGSGNCLQGMKKRRRTTWDWYSSLVVSLSIEK